jgi:hypothetical protein
VVVGQHDLLGTYDGNQKHRRQRCLPVAAEVDDMVWQRGVRYVCHSSHWREGLGSQMEGK